jgi:hypothetical protein
MLDGEADRIEDSSPPTCNNRKKAVTTHHNSGRWQPGQSGNPGGRKPGTGSLQQLRAQVELLIPEIIQVLATKARAGDVGAARLLLERVMPALKPIETPQALQISGDGLSSQAKSIVALAASGEVSVGSAAQLVSALSTVAKLIEVDDLLKRVDALEKTIESQQLSSTS